MGIRNASNQKELPLQANPGQIIIFHQARFPWNFGGFPFQKATFWGAQVAWGRYNLTSTMILGVTGVPQIMPPFKSRVLNQPPTQDDWQKTHQDDWQNTHPFTFRGFLN